MGHPFRLLRLASLLLLVAGLNQIRAGDPPAQPTPSRPDSLKEIKERQAFAEQQAQEMVKESIRQADGLVKARALDLLKRSRTTVGKNADLSPRAQVVLDAQLEKVLQRIERHGTRGDMEEKLSKPFDFAGFEDPKTTLGDAIQALQKQHDVVISLNHRAFHLDQVMDVLKFEIAALNPIPAMPRATLSRVLKQILAHVPAPSGATFIVRRGEIEITTGKGQARQRLSANTPIEKLLPVPPKGGPRIEPLLGDDLTRIPEVSFQAPQAKGVSPEAALKQTIQQMARIRHVNEKKTDRFMEALIGHRPDLAGLPFVLGDACRSKPDRQTAFAAEIELVRQSGAAGNPLGQMQAPNLAAMISDTYWDGYQASCAEADKAARGSGKAGQEHTQPARVAALMQILGPEDGPGRRGLVRTLASISDAEATRALARLVLFSSEEDVRRSAIETLQVRRERDYTDILLQGFRYPWPAVARRASEALVKLGRTDLLPRLVEVLEQPDPRLPVAKEVEGKRVALVRELVRINHHRNCLLCHAPVNEGVPLDPGNPGGAAPEPVNGGEVTGAIPIPGQPLPSPAAGYAGSPPEVFVRVDVTYLRQDFSMLQPRGRRRALAGDAAL